jgi:hypothetical protein
VDTAIEVRNGTRTNDLAQQTRALLHREGFTVAKIGNQRYSDKAKTTIFYRPGAERVARAVGRTVFLEAELATNTKLKKGINILVLLRRDLLENPQFMARLNDGGCRRTAALSAHVHGSCGPASAFTGANNPDRR